MDLTQRRKVRLEIQIKKAFFVRTIALKDLK